MRDKERAARYRWPAFTTLLVVVPLAHFRDEESTLHIVLRVAWLVLLILSLVEMGRHLYGDLRGRQVSAARSDAFRPPRGEL
jgi:hypothetical protein